mmetsp:Transcript_119637/g.316305  ORF Transcript_119637/g.316305 Transcript_119637/m.316305 type:complete len:269 (-) Transcript_119637:224-1030(-)
MEMVPSTISLRYTDVRPGNDGDSISSSTRTMFTRSRFTSLGSIFMKSFRMRWAVWRVFSYGSFFVPGRRFVARVRPSPNLSSVSMITRLSGSLGLCSTSTTRSQTRTSFLCSAASSMRRAAPPSTSLARCVRLLAWPTPNLLASMLCSDSMSWNVSKLAAIPFVSLVADGPAVSSISWIPERFAFAMSHHSYTILFPALSLSVNFAPSAWAEGAAATLPPLDAEALRPSCSLFRRSISSWRLSLMPSFASSRRRLSVGPSSAAVSDSR